MTRTKPIALAAILKFLHSAFGIVFTLALLMTRSSETLTAEQGTPPYPVLVVSLALSGIGLVAAFGVWKNQRWGKILSLILSAISVLLSLPGVFFAPTLALWLTATIGAIVNIVIIVLLLWRTPKPAMA